MMARTLIGSKLSGGLQACSRTRFLIFLALARVVGRDGMRQRTLEASVLAFLLGLVVSLAWSLLGGYGL
jgi:hypothetical protein